MPGGKESAMSAQVTERAHPRVVGLDGSPPSLAAREWNAGPAESTYAGVVLVRDRDGT